MVKSMTGYGCGQTSICDGFWYVEIQTFNSRFLDLHIRLPSGLVILEDRIRKLISQKFNRGRINLIVTHSGVLKKLSSLVLNRALVREYKRIMEELEQELGIMLDPSLFFYVIISKSDLLLVEDSNSDLNILWQSLQTALIAALNEAEIMRVAEGVVITQDIRIRLDSLEELFKNIACRSSQIIDGYRRQLQERIAKILVDFQYDTQRLVIEVANIVNRYDITEEIVRVIAHLEQLRRVIQIHEPIGRKLDFFLQEISREANTMSNKCPDITCSQLIIEVKSEIERIREQIQNIE